MTEEDDRLCVVLCNAPPDDALRIARALVERRLAACVNVVPGVVSVYRWEGALHEDQESTLLVKTRIAKVAEELRLATARGFNVLTLAEVFVLFAPVKTNFEPSLDVDR